MCFAYFSWFCRFWYLFKLHSHPCLHARAMWSQIHSCISKNNTVPGKVWFTQGTVSPFHPQKEMALGTINLCRVCDREPLCLVKTLKWKLTWSRELSHGGTSWVEEAVTAAGDTVGAECETIAKWNHVFACEALICNLLLTVEYSNISASILKFLHANLRWRRQRLNLFKQTSTEESFSHAVYKSTVYTLLLTIQ